ncbi:Predicted PurR-regulated permease PerM [Caloramator fervidus]|uniref:Predicted PurR-regulated permease PerM n=1 Tax=Caloramator fervidus TaxID=29344 RepID=A0A1H5V3L5_9CLOT|nr:AI-2E family transporter [Caloramator fervidus]SEF81007.1 Predicted PurR-regulated permease PerM [Caloramator fervidus]
MRLYRVLISLAYALIIVLFFIMSVLYLRPLLFSIFIAYMLNPIVKYINKFISNYKLCSFITIVLFLVVIVLAIFYFIPVITKEIMDLMASVGEFSKEYRKIIDFINKMQVPNYIKSMFNNALKKFQERLLIELSKFIEDILKFLSYLPTYILIPIFVYYFLSDADYFKKLLKCLIPYNIRDKMLELFRDYEKIIGNFIKGQVILSIIITFSTLAVLLLLKIKYAFIISIINGFANIIPYFGPILGFIPAFLAALTESTSKALIVAIAFFIIQEVESGVIAPKILENTMGLHPIFVIIALILGGKFFGAWGLILSVPIFAIIKVTFNYVVNRLY